MTDFIIFDMMESDYMIFGVSLAIKSELCDGNYTLSVQRISYRAT